MPVAELNLEDLLSELRHRRWTLIRWGRQDAPELLASIYRWPLHIDVLLLRSNEDATGYRTLTIEGGRAFDPPCVSWQYHASATYTMRALLALPEPRTSVWTTNSEAPARGCYLPGELPKPVVIRPLGV